MSSHRRLILGLGPTLPIGQPVNVQPYQVCLSGRCSSAGTIDVSVILSKVFRPRQFRTNVQGIGQVTIDGFYINGQNQLVGESVDAYEWSFTNVQKVQDDYLKALRLYGQTSEVIDQYLDRHKLEIPDPGKLVMPTVSKGQAVRLTGRSSKTFMDDFILVLIGPSVVSSGGNRE